MCTSSTPTAFLAAHPGPILTPSPQRVGLGRSRQYLSARQRRRPCARAPSAVVAAAEKTDLCVETHGDALTASAGSPALFIHDFMTDMRLFDYILRETSPLLPLAPCVRYDMRGFGRSPDPSEPYSRLDDLGTIHASASEKPAHLVGSGLGGCIALEYALARPDRVASVSLISSGLPGHPWQRGQRAYFKLPMLEDVGGEDEETELQKKARGLAKEWVGQSHEWRSALRKGGDVAALLKQMYVDYRCFHFWGDDQLEPDPFALLQPLSERLGNVQVPVLVLAGKEETGGKRDDFGLIAEKIVKDVPNPAYGERKVKYLDDAGHFGSVEAWEQCQAHVAEFWSALS